MKKSKNWLCILFAVLALIGTCVPARAEETDENKDVTLSPYFFIENADPKTDQFPLKGTDVSTNINGVIAETYVTQTYANEGQNPINARYVFPASSKVTIHGMKMEIGDRVITAKIKEKEEAKEEFETAKSEGKSASLLEEQRPNVFTMSVANIMPGDTIRIELHYTELVSPTDGVYQFVFPTVVGPRYQSSPVEGSDEGSNEGLEEGSGQASPYMGVPYLAEGAKGKGTYDIQVKLSTGVPITDLTSKSHKINVDMENQTLAKVSLSDPEDFAGNRDFILNYKLTGEEISSGLILGTGEEENFFMTMIQPPERITQEDIPSREYIFVLDISGSMFGYPLDTAKDLIRDLVENLQESDRFNVILFSGGSAQFSPISVPADAEHVRQAIQFIEAENGGGGTELAPALKSALAIPKNDSFSRSVIVITDGYISGEQEIFTLIKDNLNNTNFFSFGIGDGVNRYLIDGMAVTGQGEAFVVTDSEDAKSTATQFRTYIQSPILTDIKVTYEGFDAYDVEPESLATLFAQRPIIVYGKWKGEPTGTIHITGKRGGKEYTQDIQVSETTPLKSNNVIRYLWARTKVEQLSDYGLSGKDEETVRKEVTALGLKYSMMTPYTSFVAVLDIVRNENGGGDNVDQPSPLPQNVSNFAVGSGYTMGSEPGTLLMLLAILTIPAVAAINRRKKDSNERE